LAGGTDTDDPLLRAAAQRLARETVILDGHIDLPYRLNRDVEDISMDTASGQFDYPRAKQGGLDAVFMSIFTPARLEVEGGSKELADDLIETVNAFTTVWPDKFALARSPEEVEKNFEAGLISLCMGMENGSPIEGDLENVRRFYDRGVRYIGLVHSEDNHLGDSSYDTTGTWGGLSDFGKEVVGEMNRTGVMIDVSHLSDNAFLQVMELSIAPVIASHSCCRHFTPGFERNMSDEMIELLAHNGGVIQIAFGTTFLTREARDWGDRFGKERAMYFEEHGIRYGTPEAREYRSRYMENNPFPFADVADVVDHIDHVVSLVGIEHVGLGSDFDGLGDTLPTGLKDVSQYPNLIYELLKRGYTESDIRKIAHENVFRVWREVERIAAEN
jgi:membrane dipeptidase